VVFADVGLVLVEVVVFAEVLHNSVDTVQNDVRYEISVKGICSVGVIFNS